MKKILAVILAVILALSLSVAAVTAAPALPSASKVEKDLYWVGFMADGGFSGQAPDDVVHYTTYINGYLDKWEYYNEDIGLYGYKLTYDEYIGVVDSLFANHSDMKTYLENHGYYDAATGMVDFLVGGFGDSVDFVPINYYQTGDTYTVYGLKLEMAYEIEEGHVENHDYYINNGYPGQILDAVRMTYVLEDGLWKIGTFYTDNLYLIDGVLYNRGYDVMGTGEYITLTLSSIRFDVEEGATVNLEDMFLLDYMGQKWYYTDEAEYGLPFTAKAEEGYDLVSVVIKDDNGAVKVEENEGAYTINPKGDAVVTVSANPSGEKGVVVEGSAAKDNVGKASIDDSKTDLSESVLTEEELKAVEQGEDVTVYVTVDDIKDTVEKEQLEKIEKAVAEKEEIALVLDINLFKQVGGYEETQVKETKGLIKIDFEVPEEYRPKDGKEITYKIARLHDGKVDILEAEYDSKTNICSFYTDKFSTYALVVSEGVANPKTADIGVMGFVMAMAVSAVPVVIRKKK